MNVKNEVLKVLKKEKLSAGHEIGHSLSVLKNGLEISKQMNLDREVLTAALLLHDCDRRNEKKHALNSAKKAAKILEGIGFPKEKARLVFDAIKNHSRSNLRKGRKNSYSKIVYDSDKLDGIGKHAVERVSEIGRSRNWSKVQTAEWHLRGILDAAKNEPLYFQKSKTISKQKLRHSLMQRKAVLEGRFEEILSSYGFENEKQVKL